MRPVLVATALLVLAAGSALAALPPPMRLHARPRAGAAWPASPDRLRASRGIARVCGSGLETTPELLIEHVSRARATLLPTPNSTDAGDLAVLEDDGSFFYTDKSGNPKLDVAAVAEAFYRTHGDDYDALAIYLSSGIDTWLGSPGALAACYNLRNQVQGVGLESFDYGREFGSPTHLQVLLSMNGLHRYPDDPTQPFPNDNFCTLDVLAHEFGHEWLAYVFVDSAGAPTPSLLGRDDQHWNFFFDSDSSYLEGNDWAIVTPDSFRTDGAVAAFGTLDLYLMGLLPRAGVDSFFVVNDPSSFDPPGTYIPASPSLVGLGCHGRATWWTLADVEAVNGPRLPDAAASPHAFRMAVILVTAHGVAATPSDLDKLEAIRAAFGPTFAVATRGLASVDLSLTHHAGRVAIAHDPLPDTEDGAAPRPLGARVTIVQGGLPLAVDPSSVTAWWRLAGGGAFAAVPLTAAGPDSFAGALPAAPAGSTAEYYLYAGSDSAGIEATDPPAGPAAPHTYHVGADLTPPAVAHAPVREQSADRMPETLIARVTDNLGVDSVWVEYAVDGGPLQSAAVAPAGHDSFAAALLPGLGAGHALAYRFAARDRAAAHNVGVSNPGYDTLRVTDTRVWDFENGSAGFVHGAWWYSYRDAWHLTHEDSSPPGGTAWKCGAEDTTSYPVHLDAVLLPHPLASVPAGTVLQFAHRYELEAADSVSAWDGARVEGSLNGGPWQILTPQRPYDHAFTYDSNPFQLGAPCWSGSSDGWRTEAVDLTPLAPGPARIRFRMLADDLIGDAGWFVDAIRIAPPGVSAVAAGPAAGIGRPWPNPARGELRLSLALARPARVEWTLYDVAGRRVADLWRGTARSGGFTLRGVLPRVPAGLYFARLALDGRVAARDRIVLLH